MRNYIVDAARRRDPSDDLPWRPRLARLDTWRGVVADISIHRSATFAVALERLDAFCCQLVHHCFRCTSDL
ncbi:hypothetical protein WMF20_35950 [Sorangium sp. So ce834]|uniref:hypothetical protein n=1 Tax=Sorangium sp. So ce834 TaxID=3133321 RepID=UPI003F6067F4